MESTRDVGGESAVNLSEQPEFPGWLDSRSYHVFTYRDRRILYDIATGAVLAVSEPAAAILADAKTLPLDDLRDKYCAEAETLDEVAVLKEAGLFVYEGAPTEEEAERYFEVLWNHAPRRIQLFVAQSCNLCCKYCYAEQQGSNAVGQLMDFPTAKRAVDYLVEKSRNRPQLSIQFFGGEPLLNFKLIRQVVEYCQTIEKEGKKKFFYQISTNGTLLTPEVRRFLVKHKFASLVSIDGNREQHNLNRVYRNGSGSYELVVKNALALQNEYEADGQHFGQIKIRATATTGNSSFIDIADSLENAGFKYIGISAISPQPFQSQPGGFNNIEWGNVKKEMGVFRKRHINALNANTWLAYDPYRGSLSQLKETTKRFHGIMCGVGRNTNAVDTQGYIYPCHRYVGMKQYTIGDIFSGLIRNAVIDYYRSAHFTSKGKCSSCWARRLCGGACTWSLSDDTGNIWEVMDFECNKTQQSLERSLYLLDDLRYIDISNSTIFDNIDSIGPDAGG